VGSTLIKLNPLNILIDERGNMKASRYNTFFDSQDGSVLAYNCVSSGFAVIDKKKYATVEKILAAPDHYPCKTQTEKDLYDSLVKGNFLVDDKIDELDHIKARYNCSRYDTGVFSLTVIPTLNCNFRCIYCYEERQEAVMSKPVQQALLEYVKKKTAKAHTFGTIWHGGEPLLAVDIIEHLGSEFEKIANANQCKFNMGGIVTNGYLLTRTTARKLNDIGIDSVQITLDGPKDVHDKRRPLAGNKGSFDRIMKNLRDIVDIFKAVTIRVNTDRTNMHRVHEVLDVFDDLGLMEKVRIYFAQVTAQTDACQNIAGSCFHNQEYSELETRLSMEVMEKGFSLSKYPFTKAHYCMGDHVNSFVVGPMGYLYKCWSDSGNIKAAVGHISKQDEDKEKRKNLVRWYAYDVFNDEKCSQCDILPICLGGCPYQRLRARAKGIPYECDSWRYNLIEMLRLYYAGWRKHSNGKEAVLKKPLLKSDRRPVHAVPVP
jgi:uncharacterized protein